jgi:hypothetical protein
MVNPIAQIFRTNKMHDYTSLPVVQLFQDFVYRISCFQKLCIPNHLKLLQGSNFGRGKKWLYQWFRCLYYLDLYHKTSVCRMDSAKKTTSPTRKMNTQSQLLAEIRRYYWGYQRCTEPNQQNSSKDINVLWKLYSLILGEYRYTSLKLAV